MPDDREPEDHNRNKNTSNTPQGHDGEDESNPFVAFRRFADEQVSSVLQSITGLPSSVSPPQPDHWTIFTDDKAYNSMKFRQSDGDSTNNAGEQNYTSGGGAESRSSGNRNDNDNSNNNGGTSLTESSQTKRSVDMEPKNSQSRQRRSREPFDPLGLDALSFPLFTQPFPMNSIFSISMPPIFQHFDDQWPLNYITFSPYSPLHLERQARDRAHQEKGVFSSLVSSLQRESDRDPNEPQWREAFEDLLRLENGKNLLDQDRLAAGRTESEWDWLKGMVKRGSMGNRFEFVSGLNNHGSIGAHGDENHPDKIPVEGKEYLGANAEYDEADDELALYERFMQDLEVWHREFSQGITRSNILHSLLEDRRAHAHPGRPQFEDKQGNDDNESWLDLVSGGHRKSVPETPDEMILADDTSSSRIISTMSRTERTRLPDGSIQTKKVVTKRYADGREETDSSVETTHPHSGNVDSSDSGENGTKPNNGWFWKE
ncbi:uncharacterized protein N7482_002715 [Penicillium canariense]|uniref:Uncharacterized protein n=1 Tax=Penicillium canariense TaxID=189055 RepID=A0A9W9LU59_9EURO|nr:uncharacterized protein N7482_002715 [Penicillium canariense]KAJ5176838.1 hypothetical protein N7482_002715 [Penicillium canariense]